MPSAQCLRESGSGGEGRASRRHHPDDVNVVPTDCGRTARQRQSWAVPPCCFSTVLAGWGRRATHGCASLLRSVVGDRTCVHASTESCRGGACQADTDAVPPFGDLRPARIWNRVLPRDGPAPALARGASTGQPEGCSYAFWRCAFWRCALWRELCGVKLSAHEPPKGGTRTPPRGNTRGHPSCTGITAGAEAPSAAGLDRPPTEPIPRTEGAQAVPACGPVRPGYPAIVGIPRRRGHTPGCPGYRRRVIRRPASRVR